MCLHNSIWGKWQFYCSSGGVRIFSSSSIHLQGWIRGSEDPGNYCIATFLELILQFWTIFRDDGDSGGDDSGSSASGRWGGGKVGLSLQQCVGGKMQRNHQKSKIVGLREPNQLGCQFPWAGSAWRGTGWAWLLVGGGICSVTKSLLFWVTPFWYGWSWEGDTVVCKESSKEG